MKENTAMDAAPPSEAVIAEHGLSREEYQKAVTILGRVPNMTELGVFSVMWSEHCSYKSSKKWLKTLPNKAPWVIYGPGENAGAIDLGEGQAAVFKMESHNHPSFIEPYQGAATGVGGILRDIFTMGARPVANMNALRFGDPSHPKTRHLLAGVVAGIGGYGNAIGIPTVGGECEFHPGYNGNILVNAMTVGVANSQRIFTSQARGIDAPLVYVGSKTGRDGIHGATMASASFEKDSEKPRPTVQVGDPFTGKILMEACLELMKTDIIIAIQDMGAAGLTSSSFEMASKGKLGVEMILDSVPTREEGMSAYEIMLSESQERMLMVLEPGREEEAQAAFEKWGLDFAVIGRLTDSGRMVLHHQGAIVADLPIAPLAEAAPEYDRPWIETPKPPDLGPLAKPDRYDDILLDLLSSPNICDKSWIWQQYDYMVMADTVQPPGGDAAVVRLHNSGRGLAITCDCTPRYCQGDPESGAMQAVAETWRNLNAVGSRPLAVTDNLNFGNPERPDIMGQLVGAIGGIAKACHFLDFPVVSGNVSLYNETDGKAIPPTPVIGGVGLIEDISRCVGVAFAGARQTIILVGSTQGHLGASAYLWTTEKRSEGPPPPVDLEAERRNGIFVRDLIISGCVTACHDLSDGGLAVALAEMALAGNLGAQINRDEKNTLPPHAWLFGEDQARYLLTTTDTDAVLASARSADIPAQKIGTTGGQALTIEPFFSIPLTRLRPAFESWLPGYMADPAGAGHSS